MRRNIRIKGLSKVVDVPVNTVWVLNGNDLSVDSDLSQDSSEEFVGAFRLGQFAK
jgi:hypothetical protein